MPITKRRKIRGGAASAGRAASGPNNNKTSTAEQKATREVSGSSSSPAHSSAGIANQKSRDGFGAGDDTDSIYDSLVLTSEKRRGVYECDYCHTDISQLPRIRCAVCPDFDLCLDCFATTDHAAAIARIKAAASTHEAIQEEQGIESLGASGVSSAATNHLHTHGYRVCDSTRFPIFPSSRNIAPSSQQNQQQQNQTQNQSSDKMDVDDEDKPSKNEKSAPTSGTAENHSSSNSTTVTGAIMGDEDGSVSDVVVLQEDPKLAWTVEEDLRLLDGIATHGLGNWADIAEAVGGYGSTGKTPKRCMERYFDDFLGRYGHILPPYILVEDHDEEKDSSSKVDADDTTSRSSKRRQNLMMRGSSSVSVTSPGTQKKKLKAVPTESLPGYNQIWPNPYLPAVRGVQVKMGQEVARDQSSKSEQAFVKAIQGVSKEDAEETRRQWESSQLCQPGGPTVLPCRPEDVVELPGAELAGFMPRRGDFDIEWDNDAEQALADMEFLPGDPPQDRKIKLQVLAIYNDKLDEREKRKKFILSRKLHDYRKNQAEDQKLPRDERDLVRRMRLFERFHTPDEHKQFIEDILKAKRIRKEIAKLQLYRRIGIRSLAEAEKYELDKSRRQFHKMAQLQNPGAPSNIPSNADSATASGNTTGGEDSGSSLWKQYRTSDRKGRRRGNATGSINPPISRNKSKADVGMASDDSSKIVNTGNAETTKMNNEKKNNNSEQSSSTESDKHFDMKHCEGFDLLTPKEVNLCEKTRLLPSQYLEIKKVLIHEALTRGLLDNEETGARRTIVKIDVEQRGDVVDFMVRAGWISGKLGMAARNIAT